MKLNMDKICRFCLKVYIKNMCSLEEYDILYNIQRFLKLDISTEDSFPNNICKNCFKKMSLIIKFCINVKENEDKLQQYSKTGLLQDYYLKITNDTQIKEDDQNEFKLETLYMKMEDDTDTDLENDDNLKNEELPIEFNDINDFNNTPCSSDDDVTLSSIKKTKESTIITDEKPKKITKFRPIKSLREATWKKRSAPQNFEHLKQFTCLTCLKPCDSQTDLIKHYNVEHYNNKIAGSKYSEHKTDGKTLYSCNSCEKTFSLKKDINKHVLSHTDERPLSCKVCARTYRTVQEIVRHARAHNGFKLQCPHDCGFTTPYPGALKDHVSRHLNEFKYTCDKCGKGFNIKTWYEQHQNVHSGLRPFVCNVCGLAFPMSRYLQTHKASMHPQSSNLKRYSCVHCDEKCDSANSLAIHMQKHGINKDTDLLCDYCGKILSTPYQLQYHHRMHLGIKPHPCPICKKRFAKKYNVRLHMIVHSGDKLHSCSQCGKQYSQRSTLLKHLRRYHADTSSNHTG